MTLKDKHTKHVPIQRKSIHHYGRNEWAVYGQTCNWVNQFFATIKSHFSSQYQLLFVDADHDEKKAETLLQFSEKRFDGGDFVIDEAFGEKMYSSSFDAVFVNGNHYPAHQQIVIQNDQKKDSLLRRVDQLTNVSVLVKSPNEEIYPFLQDKISDQTMIIDSSHEDALLSHLQKILLQSIPPLKGLVLAGGKSKRMGQDKSKMAYNGKVEQQVKMASLLQNVGIEAMISKDHLFTETEIDGFTVVKDEFLHVGPLAGMLSAWKKEPDTAFLVIACDLPLITKEIIQELITARDTSKYATAFQSLHKDFPDPLCTIYEPRSYQRLLSMLSLGYSCPRKFLINSNVKLVEVDDDSFLMNVNTPEDVERIKQI